MKDLDSYIKTHFSNLGDLQETMSQAIGDEKFWAMLRGLNEETGDGVYIITTDKAVHIFYKKLFFKPTYEKLPKEILLSVNKSSGLFGALSITSISKTIVIKCGTAINLDSSIVIKSYTAINCLIEGKDFLELPQDTFAHKDTSKNILGILFIFVIFFIFSSVVQNCSTESSESAPPQEVIKKETEQNVEDKAKQYLLNIIKDSDDYDKYKSTFDTVSYNLIQEGICTYKDFTDNGTWLRSNFYKENKISGKIIVNPSGEPVKGSNLFRKAPIYFMYCGELHGSDKVYLNAKTKKISQIFPTDNDGQLIY
jgi:hypothetical protein